MAKSQVNSRFQGIEMVSKKKIVLAGATGFIGQELGIALVREGFEVSVLTRTPKKYEGRLAFPCKLIAFEKTQMSAAEEAIDGAYAVINLVGESIESGTWDLVGKRSVYASRLEPIALLVAAVKKAKLPPKLFLQASATGYYGKTDELCTEEHPPAPESESFLAKVCIDLEAEGQRVEAYGTRFNAMRIGVVLGHGRALEKINQLYASGVGSRFLGTEGYFPWVAIDDVVAAFVFMAQQAEAKQITGPVNVVGPHTATLSHLHTAMTKVHGMQLAPPAPAWIVRKLARKQAVLLFDSARVSPKKLLASGFKFSFNTLEKSIESLFPSGYKGQFRLVKKQFVRADMNEIWKFFSMPQNLEAITPPWLRFKIKNISTEVMGNGTTIHYDLRLNGIPITWKSVISEYVEKKQFKDEQLVGPYHIWEHTHKFETLGDGVLIIDDIIYSLPLGKAGTMVASWYVQKDVGQIFKYRADVVAKTLNGAETTH
jgi:uncharacterized protein (TIGR01777 family)